MSQHDPTNSDSPDTDDDQSAEFPKPVGQQNGRRDQPDPPSARRDLSVTHRAQVNDGEPTTQRTWFTDRDAEGLDAWVSADTDTTVDLLTKQ